MTKTNINTFFYHTIKLWSDKIEDFLTISSLNEDVITSLEKKYKDEVENITTTSVPAATYVAEEDRNNFLCKILDLTRARESKEYIFLIEDVKEIEFDKFY